MVANNVFGLPVPSAMLSALSPHLEGSVEFLSPPPPPPPKKEVCIIAQFCLKLEGALKLVVEETVHE